MRFNLIFHGWFCVVALRIWSDLDWITFIWVWIHFYFIIEAHHDQGQRILVVHLHVVLVQLVPRVHLETQSVAANLGWFPNQIQSQDVVQNVSVTPIVNMVLHARIKNVLKTWIFVIHLLVDRVQTVWSIVMVTQFADAMKAWFLILTLLLDASQSESGTLTVIMATFARTKNVLKTFRTGSISKILYSKYITEKYNNVLVHIPLTTFKS